MYMYKVYLYQRIIHHSKFMIYNVVLSIVLPKLNYVTHRYGALYYASQFFIINGIYTLLFNLFMFITTFIIFGYCITACTLLHY
jgi:ABC-type multidrug transport system permease subunit